MITNLNPGISNISNNNNSNAEPTTLTTESLLGSLNEKDRIIYERNNIRLRQMEAEVRQLATYGGACDELLEWLSDVRAYNPYNEKALLGCINAIYEKASEYGAWSGLEILKEANQKCGNGLSEKGRACIKKCYEDLHNSVTGRRPSNASMVSTASASHPSPASLASNRSVSHVNIPGSPTTNNSYSQLIKILDASVFPQSPNSNIGSPLPSPQFRGIDVSASQTTPNQAVNSNTMNTNDNHLNYYLQQRAAQAAQAAQAKQHEQQYPHQYQYPYQYQQQQIMQQQRLNPAQIQQAQQMQIEQIRKAQYENQARLQEEQRKVQEEQRKAQEEQLRKAQEEQRRMLRQKEIQRQKEQFELQQKLRQQQQQLQLQQQLQKQQQKQQQEEQQRQAVARHYMQVFGQSSLPLAPSNMPSNVAMPSVSTHLQNSASVAAVSKFLSNAQQQPAPSVNNYNASIAFTTNTTAAAVAPIATTSATTPVALTNPGSTPVNAIVPAMSFTYNPANSASIASTASPITSNPEHIYVGLSPPVRTDSLPANAAVVISRPAAVPTTPTTPTTPNTPIKASTMNSSTSDYASPSLPSIDISKIHLPGGGSVHKPAVPAAIPATSLEDNWTRPNGQGDKIEFLFKIKHAFPSFRLAHGEMITRKPFFIGKQEYNKLFKNPNSTLKDYQGQPPLSYFITAWYENTTERKCDWPTGVRIELNNQNLPLQKREKVINPNGGPSTITGKDKPFDITRLLALDKNTIVIHQPKCACVTKKSYLFAVHVFMRLSENYILGLVKNTVISIEKSEQVIDNFLGGGQTAKDDDEDLVIVQSSLKMTLKCPLTFKKMKHPVKGVNCKHVNCFDLDAYLMVNKNENPTWACPHCNNETGPTALTRDLLVERLLETLPKRAAEIEYTGDHTNYTIIKMDDPDSDDDDDDDDDGKDATDARNTSEVKAKNEQIVHKTLNNDNVIDLISDDEDEGDQGVAQSSTTASSKVPSKRTWESQNH